MISGKLIKNDPTVSTMSTYGGTLWTNTNQHREGVMRLYAAENVIAYLTGVKGYDINTDKEFNTTFSVYTDDNKTYKFDIRDFHFAMFEGEKVYITQNGRYYEQSQADRLAAKQAKEAKERLEREKEYKINNFDSLAEKYDNLTEQYNNLTEQYNNLIRQHHKDHNYKELLTQVLDIISADHPIGPRDMFGLPVFVRRALDANKEKYKRRYK